jgi:hypothetical protein
LASRPGSVLASVEGRTREDEEEDEVLSASFDDWLRRSLIEADASLPPQVEMAILELGDCAVAALIEILEDRALLDRGDDGAPSMPPCFSASSVRSRRFRRSWRR